MKKYSGFGIAARIVLTGWGLFFILVAALGDKETQFFWVIGSIVLLIVFISLLDSEEEEKKEEQKFDPVKAVFGCVYIFRNFFK